MPKLDRITHCSRIGEFTLFVGKIGTRSMAGIHLPKEGFEYTSNNSYRSCIKHSLKKLFGEWLGFGKHKSVTVGWTNYPSLATYDNSIVTACTFTQGMTEFAALSIWIRKVLSWPVRQQKSGWTNKQIDEWFDQQLKIKRRVSNVTITTSGFGIRPTQDNGGSS